MGPTHGLCLTSDMLGSRARRPSGTAPGYMS
ncbi:hypothetical protein A2U01_0095404, partial [Trifolium medium]|nr:hypothetical protein [Trifolium medium]